MKKNELIPRPKRRFKATTDSRNSIRIAPNLLQRDSTLEFECIRGITFESHRSLVFTLADYIERFYNPQRLHATLGYVSPIEAELTFLLESQAA